MKGLSSLLHERGRDILAFCFFLFISFGFWLLQKLDDSFDAKIKVPLELVGVPNGTIITSPLSEEVTVTIQDRGTNLFDYWRRSRRVEPIRLDFATYDNGAVAGKVTIPPSDVQSLFQQQMLPSTQIKFIEPSAFEVHYNRGVKKVLPVCYAGQISTHQQSYLQDVTFTPDSVTVYAPASMLDTMHCAYAEHMDISNLQRTTSYTLGFSKISGVKVVPETVKMLVKVDYYTEQTVKVPIVGLNFPHGMSLKTFPAMVTLKYRVGAANARNIKAEDFLIAATYQELLNNKTQKLHIRLTEVPLGVSNVRIYPHEVDYLLEYSNQVNALSNGSEGTE